MAWHRVCLLNELDETHGSEFVVAGYVVAVFKRGTEVRAIDGMCAHQGGPLAQGSLDGKCLTCPWHGWQYDIQTGCNLLTGKRMLNVFEVEQRDDSVWIDVPDET